MTRSFVVIILSVSLAVVLAASAAAGPGGQSQGRRTVKAIVSVEGIITAVNESRSSFTMRVLTPGHQRLVGATTMTVLVQSGANIHFARGDDDIDRPARPARTSEFRVGDRVHVQAIRLDNGQFLAMRVTVQNRQAPAGIDTGARRQTAQGRAVQFAGVVVERGNPLRVRQANGTTRVVLITPSTEITGRVRAARDIRVGDPVEVRGTLNADGSVVANRIAVLRASALGPGSPLGPGSGAAALDGAVTGTILMKNSTGARFLILSSGQAVSVSEATQIVSGGRLRSFDDLRIGMTITVYGTPISLSGLTLGINALLITY